ncbi:MAG: glyoxalase/bleomycin resistance/extradiol dioxygenase family protein [Acidimicrobiia bacterium]|nr:glyoxalase/bleomycin resistance/extradiol dioxygenase family protein [Acidimicrobiia bacterium]
MARVQLALNVADLDQAVDFYSRLFGVAPNKRKPGYANFAVADPPLKLVLFEAPDASERLNHLGVEVETTDEVGQAAARMSDAGLPTVNEDATTCCYAVQDKVWIEGPDGPWEWYTVLADAETMSSCASTECC